MRRLVAFLVGLEDGGGLPQAFCQCGGSGAGDGVGMVESGSVAGDADGNRLPGGEEAFPGQAGEALLEFGEGGGVEEIAQPGQDAAGGAQVQVGAVESSSDRL